MQVLTASEARANLYRLIDEAAESHEPIVIAGKCNKAVLLSAEDWSAIQETLFLLSLPDMCESIRQRHSGALDRECRRARLVSRQVVFAKQALEDAVPPGSSRSPGTARRRGAGSVSKPSAL